MLKKDFVALQREQFALLREGKRLVLKEFGKKLSLQDKDILEQLYGFALDSKEEELFEIFSRLREGA